MTNTDQLMFVYNADAGLFSALSDAIHKLVSPDTYPCSLCAVTYGAVSMRPTWRRYINALPVTPRFYHRDDFRAAWPGIDVPLPAVLRLPPGGSPVLLIGPAILDQQRSVEELIATLDNALMRST